MKSRIIAALLGLTLGISCTQAIVPVQKAEAAMASQFNPGMVISDAIFYDGGSLGIVSVQNFLNSQVKTCAAGYTCLKDFTQSTINKAAVPNRCSAYQGMVNESAAQIIARVGAACGISQKALLVLLEKEQGLVRSGSPSEAAYRIATGYGCPDTAACDSTYYGFFNQLWMAALQFKIYLTSPNSFNARVGQVNQVRFNPNSSCGAGPVFIQNAATAGLYNYTPYQPNAAALANLYGTGDGCSSYGNRNFWSIFTDWFGSTSTGSLVRTMDNATVYLVVGTVKYPVVSFGVYTSFSALGAASMVSQTYLDTLGTSHALTRIVRGPDDALYFVDSAYKLQFTSCQQVVDYGGSCDPTGYAQLTAAQVAVFQTGPYVTPVLGTREGPRYWLSNGAKHEVLDDASLSAAGIGLGNNVLTENSLSDLPFGAPVIRASAFVNSLGSSSYNLLAGGLRYPVLASDIDIAGAVSRRAGTLRPESLALVPSAPANFNGLLTVSGSMTVQALRQGGRSPISVAALASSATGVVVSQDLINSYNDLGPIVVGSLVKSSVDDSVSLVTAIALRHVGSWKTLVAIAGTQNPNIAVLTSGAMTAMPTGQMVLMPGGMYRTVDNEQIYMADGLSGKIAVGNFDFTAAAGFTVWSYAAAETLKSYTTNKTALTYGYQCDSMAYVAVGGFLRAVPNDMKTTFPFNFVALDPVTCSQTTIGEAAIDFIRIADGSIYQLSGGQKHHVGARSLTQINGGRGWMQVPDSFAALFLTGTSV